MALSRPLRISLWIIALIVVAGAVGASIAAARFEPIARNYVISALRERYKSDVELGRLQIGLFPTVHATGENLALHFTDSPGTQPMIAVRRVTIYTNLAGLFSKPKRIDRVRLEGLQLHIPPKRATASHGENPVISFVLEDVVADGATLETLPAVPGKEPLTFTIHTLTLHSVGPGRPMIFHAELENAKPPGLIHSDGNFGPWNQDEPGDTAVNGHYTFGGADLSVFKGIRGTLNSSGDYHGQLNRIDVHGTTDVAAFSLTTGGNALPLQTEFDATVDGTNGNTDLHPVLARLGRSAFEVRGSIERHALETHKEIDLEARAKGTGLADFLRLSIGSSAPPMKGSITFDTKVKIPAGETPVLRRMQLAGGFALKNVTFTSETVQQKISSLSHHAEGQPKETNTDVESQFSGRFGLQDGVLSLPSLKFEVPGADINLAGKYTIQSGAIDFKGTARLKATVSQMTTGVKHVLLKPIDPLFRHDGAGTELPIKITGTRGSPSFHLELGRALKHKDAE